MREAMPRLKDASPVGPHPSIVRGPYWGSYCGKGRMMVDICCPKCLQTRSRTASETRKELTRTNFKGLCRPCSFASVQDGTHRWHNTRKNRRGETSGGYSLTYPDEVEDALLPMYRAMQRFGQPVMGHRWAMAMHLGRALTSEELVDHMDGHKDHNTIDNLRLYVRGKQQAGSAPGHGTYYHEWQMTLAELRKLRGEQGPH